MTVKAIRVKDDEKLKVIVAVMEQKGQEELLMLHQLLVTAI